MEVSEEYYAALGIRRDASTEEIKKAYKKLAVKWHPDKNPNQIEIAEMNFKRVGEAYQVLSDPQQREVYDRYGKDGLVNGGGGNRYGPDDMFGGFPPFQHGFSFSFRDPMQIFEEIFGSGNDPFAAFFQGPRGSRSSQMPSMFSGPLMDPFGMFGGNMSMSTMSMSFGGPSVGAYGKRTSKTIKNVNGKQIETKT